MPANQAKAIIPNIQLFDFEASETLQGQRKYSVIQLAKKLKLRSGFNNKTMTEVRPQDFTKNHIK